MEETNNQYDSTNVDNDDGIIDIDSNNEVEDGEDEDKPQVLLDKKVFNRLKQNDSGVTNLRVPLRDNYFNSINWKEEKNGDFISDNTQLKKLSICTTPTNNTNYLLGPPRKQLEGFFSCVYRNSSITVLSFSSFQIINEVGGGLIEGLCGHPSLIRFEIKGGRLGSIGCEALGKVLKHPESKLRDLSLFNCHLDDEGFGIVCDGLLGNSTLKKLCLDGNYQITSVGWRALSAVLQHPNCKSATLALNCNSINDEGIDILGSALSGSSVNTLNLGYNPSISSAGWQIFLHQLSHTSVHCLDLYSNQIDDSGLITLANIGTLKSLDLSYNHNVTSSGWQSFFNKLTIRGTQLVKLNCSFNYIGNEDVAALGRLLSNIISLKTLDMNGLSQITSQGWVSLLSSIQHSNFDLTRLTLNKNSINDDAMHLLASSVSRMDSLKYLELNENRSVTPTGWQALTAYFRSPNFALKSLTLNGNNINYETVIAFTSALAHNKTLESLSLDGCINGDGNQLIITRGWRAVSILLCNKTSIMDTYNSNHTLQGLGHRQNRHMPDDLISYLELNKNKDKVEVTRQKILQTHFSTEYDTASNIQKMLDMDLVMLPSAIAWIGRPLPIGWEGVQVSDCLPCSICCEDCPICLIRVLKRSHLQQRGSVVCRRSLSIYHIYHI